MCPGGRVVAVAAGMVDGAEHEAGPLEVQQWQEGAAGSLGLQQPSACCRAWQLESMSVGANGVGQDAIAAAGCGIQEGWDTTIGLARFVQSARVLGTA